MNHNFRPGSCPEAIYDMLEIGESLTLKEIYHILPEHAHSSIRRSLYDLQDEFIVEKTEDGTKWKTVV